MSLYRQPSRTRATVLAAVAVVALALGGGIGFALGRSSAPEPAAGDVVDQLREQLRPAVNGLQLLATEYPQAARGTGDEAAGVQGAMARIRDAVRAARPDLAVLDPRGAAELGARVAALDRGVRASAPVDEVAEQVRLARRALAGVPGGR
ncbi:MAG TPA: hypothetical protein VGJ32_01865 [Solirubrobacteraceae bacterium]